MEPWLAMLNDGHGDAAWTLFADRYRPLLQSTIRRLIRDHDDLMDVYSFVCEALSADDCARLRRYSSAARHEATIATWLVVVVRNLTIDWIRQRDGRQSRSVPANLSPLQQAIYTAICLDRGTPAEAYERIRARTGEPMPFAEFLREVRVMREVAPCRGHVARRPMQLEAIPPWLVTPMSDPAELADVVRRLQGVLAIQPADLRLAIELFVVEELPAADVARVVGWPNAKAVYNRVSRALASMRAGFAAEGIDRGDL